MPSTPKEYTYDVHYLVSLDGEPWKSVKKLTTKTLTTDKPDTLRVYDRFIQKSPKTWDWLHDKTAKANNEFRKIVVTEPGEIPALLK